MTFLEAVASSRRERVDRALAWVDTAVTAGLLFLALDLHRGGLTMREVEPHGGFFLNVGAVLAVIAAVFFAVAALGMFLRTTWRWTAQLVPITVPLILWAVLRWAPL